MPRSSSFESSPSTFSMSSAACAPDGDARIERGAQRAGKRTRTRQRSPFFGRTTLEGDLPHPALCDDAVERCGQGRVRAWLSALGILPGRCRKGLHASAAARACHSLNSKLTGRAAGNAMILLGAGPAGSPSSVATKRTSCGTGPAGGIDDQRVACIVPMWARCKSRCAEP